MVLQDAPMINNQGIRDRRHNATMIPDRLIIIQIFAN